MIASEFKAKTHNLTEVIFSQENKEQDVRSYWIFQKHNIINFLILQWTNFFHSHPNEKVWTVGVHLKYQSFKEMSKLLETWK